MNRGAGELELLALIQTDLSVLAQAVAPLSDEYIIFAEFALGSGRVDFAVFADRSRMVVTFVEIKGAGFSLVTKAGAIDWRANLAAQQVRQRLGVAARDYSNIRPEVHRRRQQALTGPTSARVLVGTAGLPHVDPDKDVSFHGVVIAGRTQTGDLVASGIRHDFEQAEPRLRLHSWDSWLDRQR